MTNTKRVHRKIDRAIASSIRKALSAGYIEETGERRSGDVLYRSTAAGNAYAAAERAKREGAAS